MRMLRSSLLLAGILAGTMLVSGCGYSMEPMHPTDVKTVYVSMFTRGKDVYRRGIEFRLTEAVVKRIQQDTQYRIVDKAKADTQLTGSLDLIPQRVLSFNPDTGLPNELEMTLVASFTWVDLRTGKTRVKRTNVRETATYVQASPLNEDFFQGSEDAVNRLAITIVEQMEKDDW